MTPASTPPLPDDDLPTIDPIEEMVADYIGLRLEQIELSPEEFAERAPEGMRPELLERLRRYESVRDALPQALHSMQKTPEFIGDFRVQGELGRGGAGVVFRAEQLSLRRQVALKILPPAAGLSANAIERFLDGAVAAARLRHPNIVPVYTAGEQDGLLYLSMEYVPGPTLSQALRRLRAVPLAERSGDDLAGCLDQSERQLRGRPPVGRHDPRGRSWEEVVLRMGEGLAEALAYCHRCGVLHRDIKPGNIILAPDGTPKLVDFGLARVEDVRERVTMTGEVWGTPQYLAPERINIGLKAADAAGEVYSLAAVLYECLTDHPPYEGEDGALAALLLKIAHEDPEPLESQGVSPDLAHVLETAMARDPKRRHPTPMALGEDLRAVRKGRRPVHAYRLRPRRTRTTRRRTLWATSAVLLALIAFLGLLGGPHEEAREDVQALLVTVRRSELVGRVDEALERLRVALARDAGDPWLRFELAALLMRAGRGDEAQVQWTALGDPPADSLLGRHVRALRLRREGRSAEALAVFDEALREHPDHRWTHVERALLAVELGRSREGLATLLEVLER